MASKYAAVINSLPRNFGEEPDHQARIDAIRREILAPPDPEKKPLSEEAIEDLCDEAAALIQVMSDSLINAVHGERTSAKFARVYRSIRMIKKVFEAQEKSLNVIQAAYEQILVDQFEAEGVSTVKFLDGGSVRFQVEPHASVVDKDANRQWAIENGYEKSLALPWQTVNAIAKAALLEGVDGPAGVELDARPKVVFTKG